MTRALDTSVCLVEVRYGFGTFTPLFSGYSWAQSCWIINEDRRLAGLGDFPCQNLNGVLYFYNNNPEGQNAITYRVSEVGDDQAAGN